MKQKNNKKLKARINGTKGWAEFARNPLNKLFYCVKASDNLMRIGLYGQNAQTSKTLLDKHRVAYEWENE